ncbi:MAG: ATP-binding protein [Hydrogenophaga sp.]|nr:ATP-binding protein [Hydrogenophaga sp.]
MDNHTPPDNPLEVMAKLEYEEALPDGDARYVPTQEARGSEQTMTRLARKFGWNPSNNKFFAPTDKHVLFFGHIGSGKTTELRRYMGRFNASKHFFVVEVDVLAKLDRNNLQYSEVLMAMAESLLEQLAREGFGVDEDALRPLREWFAPAVHTHTESSELNAELKTGLQAGGGIPGILKLLASFTTSFRTGASRKTEWRQEIRNRFTTLALAFSGLIRHVEQLLKVKGRAERVLFLIDGTDKMRGDDTQAFFVHDAEQLLSIQTLALYTAPLHLKYDGSLGGKLDADIVLPMIKLYTQEGERWEPGWTALRELLLHRAARSLFEEGDTGEVQIQRLVEHCGGHPRELLRLLKLCCEWADERIDATVVDHALNQLASEYRRFLRPEDYTLLAELDANPIHGGNDKRAQELLYRLALLEYNDGGWRRSHPVVRRLAGYLQAQSLLKQAAQPAAAVSSTPPSAHATGT